LGVGEANGFIRKISEKPKTTFFLKTVFWIALKGSLRVIGAKFLATNRTFLEYQKMPIDLAHKDFWVVS
jgi:hypothetical protein